ncbi:MAG: glycosyltransferase family 4 protein [Candidatus Kapabacteria bacterium]|nr:glycosyltransferase family 4 protein [Candidatus Kapabacteria bacterium]
MEISKKIKLLFWRTDFYGAQILGGVNTMHNGMVEGFHKLGCEISFVNGGEPYLPEYVKNIHIPFNKIFMNLPEVLCLPYNRKAINVVKKLIRNDKPDFIFQHHHDFNWGGAIIKKELGIPFFLHCDGVQIWVKKNWGKLYFDKLLRIAEEIQWDAADAIFVPSSVVKRMMIDYGVDPIKVVVNPNGTDPDKFRPDIDGKRIIQKYKLENKFVCGFSGTFGQWHGVDVLAEAAKAIISKIPNAILFFIGDGMMRAKVEEIIQKSNVGNNCIITGFVNHYEIPEYLAACNVLLSPTVQNDDNSEFFGSPTKLFEYMAMGKPIVATSVGQLGEVIQDSENGILCEQKQPEALAEAVQKIYSDENLAIKISEGARKSAIEKYDWKVNVTRIINKYQQLSH